MNRVTGVSPAVAAHKQLIVSRVKMADGRNHSGGQSLRFETSPGGRAPHPTTAPSSSVCCDRLRFSRRTPWEQSRDRIGHVHDEIAIFFGTTHLVPFASSSALLTIGKAFFLSPLQRSLFYQDALAFVPRDRLKRTTTADSALYLLARRVRAASPLGR